MVGREQILNHVTRLLESPGLSASPSLAKLLVFCVNTTLAGDEESLKETLIGISCFGRSPGYDTRQDPIVRVSAGRLRTKLDLFYQHEGAASEVRIHLPKGSYVPRFIRHVENVEPAEPAVAPPVAPATFLPLPNIAPPSYLWRVLAPLSILLLLLLAVSSVLLIRSDRATTVADQRPAGKLPVEALPLAQTHLSLSTSTESTDQEKIEFSSHGNPSPVPRVFLQSRSRRQMPGRAARVFRKTDLASSASSNRWTPQAEDASYGPPGASEPRL
jgi:hypothetical protein